MIDVIKEYEEGRRDFSGLDLSFANFEGANFSGANFSGTDLWGAHFADANLEDADFADADLRGTNFLGADLLGANFLGADMWYIKGISFFRCNKHLIIKYKDRVKVGCRDMSIADALIHGPQIAKAEGYTDFEIEMYMKFVKEG